jgi:hypothetical protein
MKRKMGGKLGGENGRGYGRGYVLFCCLFVLFCYVLFCYVLFWFENKNNNKKNKIKK